MRLRVKKAFSSGKAGDEFTLTYLSKGKKTDFFFRWIASVDNHDRLRVYSSSAYCAGFSDVHDFNLTAGVFLCGVRNVSVWMIK